MLSDTPNRMTLDGNDAPWNEPDEDDVELDPDEFEPDEWMGDDED